MPQERKPTLREKTAHRLSLPPGSLGAVPRLELTGDGDLYLQAYKDILAYSKEEICVDGGPWMLRVSGRGLEIKAMAPGELRLAGQVYGVELV